MSLFTPYNKNVSTITTYLATCYPNTASNSSQRRISCHKF